METPRRLDPAAAERVLRRASELAHSGAPRADPSEGMDSAALIEAAVEVGIPADAVRRALAIEELGPANERAALDPVVGSRTVIEQRDVPLGVDATMRAIDDWLVIGHHLRRERTQLEAGEWGRRSDPIARVLRTTRGLSGEGRLGSAQRITAGAAEVADDTSVVRVSVDRSSSRAGVLATSAAVTAVGVGGGIAVGVLITPFALAAAPMGLFAGALITRKGRRHEDRLRREVVRMLDAVEQGRPPDKIRHHVVNSLRSSRR